MNDAVDAAGVCAEAAVADIFLSSSRPIAIDESF